mmetsp:Transcript_40062/g.94068  ORF Transcript_40062/g.94068 Transcript_40062/m.94068 type:complete len:155 (-) Transcript_40062:690-1154(-)
MYDPGHRAMDKVVATQPSMLQQIAMAGAAAIFTVIFTHPIDLVKTRIQVSKEYATLGIFGSGKHIASKDGVFGLYSGINAACLREASYTSIRMGLYEPWKVRVVQLNHIEMNIAVTFVFLDCIWLHHTRKYHFFEKVCCWLYLWRSWINCWKSF